MRRRGITVLVGAVLAALLTAAVFMTDVPYVQLEPGPTVDTLGTADGKTDGKPVVTIDGASSSTSAGQLRFVTVGVQSDLTLLDALRGWFRDDDAVVPRELIYPSDQSEQEVDQHNKEEFTSSQTSAETAALTALGYPIRVGVTEVTAGAPADKVLRTGDVIKTVDGTTIPTSTELIEIISKKPVGTALSLGIVRAGKALTVKITTAAGEAGRSRIGAVVRNEQKHPFKISFAAQDVGGPSAGLMLALGIIDKVKPEDLTGGTVIAGTGTIDDAGAVGPIGGVPQKLRAAKRDGATVFLTPKDNCAEAVDNAPAGLQLVEVASLDGALTALATLRSGGRPKLCPGAR